MTDYLSPDIITFFEGFDTWRVWSVPHMLRFVPFADPAILDRLWDFSEYDGDGEYPYATSLYGDPELDDGGLNFDMATNPACWVMMPGRWPKAGDWIPLEEVLNEWLSMWDLSKVYWNEEQDTIDTRQWVTSDLERDPKVWENLLDVIAERMPVTGDSNSPEMIMGMVDKQVLP